MTQTLHLKFSAAHVFSVLYCLEFLESKEITDYKKFQLGALDTYFTD